MPAETGLHARDLVATVRRAAAAGSDVRERATLEVLDAVACMRLGASHPLVTTVAAAGAWGGTGRHRSFAGEGHPLEQAVRLDALACHVDELDSIEPGAAVLPAALVVPAAWHVAELRGSSGTALLDAVVAGYDVVSLAGRALGGPAAYAHGWWPTSTVGALGAAAAVGLLLDLDDDALAAAFGLAAARTGGLLSDDDLGAGHYLAAADAAVAGLRAAHLAGAGLTASATYLCGPTSRAFPTWSDPGPREPGDGVRATTTKPYPCARPLQSVAAALETGPHRVDGLAAITVELPAPLLRFVTTDVEVPDATRAAASLAHVVAAVREGRAGDARFFRTASLEGLAPLPTLELRPWADAPAGAWGCRLLLRAHDGTEVTVLAEPPTVPPGRLRVKALRVLADAGVAPDVVGPVLDDLGRLDSAPTVSGLRLHRRLAAVRGV